MRRPRRNQALVLALCSNAILLLMILVALLAGGGRMPSVLPEAFAAPLAPQPIAGGSGVYLMPAQFADKNWGCYVMDVDAQTLCAYQYFPGDKKLRLVAARNFRHDRRLHDFNTDNPSPAEVEKLLALEQSGRRDNPDAAKAPAPGAPGAGGAAAPDGQ
jgi:hypothetical protein